MNRARVEGSSEQLRPGERWAAALPCDQKIGVTIYLRRWADAPPGTVAADPADMEAVEEFLTQSGVSLVRTDAASRRIWISGTVDQMQAAFGIQLRSIQASDGHQFVSYEGPISIPAALAPVITAVLGLSQRSVAQPH